jgi:Holliday junction resolvase
MSGQNYERELRDILRKEGWVVFRSAGSHVADLIALKPDDHMIIEVKATKYNNYRTTLDKPQFDLLNAYAKQGFNVFYYIRWKGLKTWSKFKLPLDPYPVFR